MVACGGFRYFTWGFVSLGGVCVMYLEVSAARQFMCLVG